MKRLKKWMALFSTQFLGVLNDNFLKGLICFISAYWFAEEEMIIGLASAMLVVPFVLFSPLAAKWAQVHSKRKIVVWAKFAEIPIMVVASAGFALSNLSLVMMALFLMGLQSAIYSPAKYGMIKTIEGAKGASYGSGIMEGLAFSGVLLGTLLAGYVADFGNSLPLIITSLLGLAVAGWLTSIKMTESEGLMESERISVNPYKFMKASYQKAKQIPGLNKVVLGLSSFWLVGSLLQMTLMVFLPQEFGYSSKETGLVLAGVAVAIGLGCFFTGRLSGNKVEMGWVCVGLFGMTVSMGALAWLHLNETMYLVTLFVTAFSSGFYKVPLNAWMQANIPNKRLSTILAYNNMVVFLFILLSAGLFSLFGSAMGVASILKLVSILCLMMLIYSTRSLIKPLVRLFFIGVGRLLYRVRLGGGENIPEKGGALLLANHISYLDSFIIAISVPRMVTFVMLDKVYYHPFGHWFFRRMNMIPVSQGGGPEALKKFNVKCVSELRKGNLVCLFPEGQLTRTGDLQDIRKGFEHVAKEAKVPIIPLFMERVFGGPLTFNPVKEKFHMPGISKLRRKVYVGIGALEAYHLKADDLYTRFRELQEGLHVRYDLALIYSPNTQVFRVSKR